MSNFKLPPREKIHEALSAIADSRVVLNDTSADVASSDYTKTYLVEWKEETYSCNDNASYWQGYLGYPIIAVLMLQNKLSYNKEILKYFKNINWKAINTKHKNDYKLSVEEVYSNLSSEGVDINKLDSEISLIYNQLPKLSINQTKSKKMPPK